MVQPFHFTKDIGKDFSNFYKKVIDCNGLVCFDFEDSIQVEDQNRIISWKDNHRNTIIQKLIGLSSPIQYDRIGFRINGADSLFYFDDLQAITKLNRAHCIFLPKVESSSQVKNLIKEIPKFVTEIIPIIETKKGFENIDEILQIDNSRFIRIAFGHCDFNLSNQYFPFYHQDSAVYWEWIQKLAQHVKLKGKKLINSPVLNLENSEFFSQVLLKNKLYENISGQITLCLKQTLLCAMPETPADIDITSLNKTSPDKLEEAISIIDSFEKYKIKDRFFAIDENGRLISPQEYQMAKLILKKITV